jgi:hypothetical protein
LCTSGLMLQHAAAGVSEAGTASHQQQADAQPHDGQLEDPPAGGDGHDGDAAPHSAAEPEAQEDAQFARLEAAEQYDAFPAAEPLFLPPFANEENKKLGSYVQARNSAQPPACAEGAALLDSQAPTAPMPVENSAFGSVVSSGVCTH